jgi:ElaB/YqjD/DUF883 family membrane-anchored ribosome-binding protein
VNNNGAGRDKPDVQALRAEIQQTRHDLGETVQALAAKADVKARAKEQVAQAKLKVRASVGQATDKVRDSAVHAAHSAEGYAHEASVRAKRNPVPLAAVLAVGAAVVVAVILLRRSRR